MSALSLTRCARNPLRAEPCYLRNIPSRDWCFDSFRHIATRDCGARIFQMLPRWPREQCCIAQIGKRRRDRISRSSAGSYRKQASVGLDVPCAQKPRPGRILVPRDVVARNCATERVICHGFDTAAHGREPRMHRMRHLQLISNRTTLSSMCSFRHLRTRL